MSAPDVFAVILAAGASSRMGACKALLPMGTRTALERCVHLFMADGLSDIRVVTGACGRTTLQHPLPDLAVKWVHNEAHHQGMFSSICKGLSSPIRPGSAFFLLPVDIPLVRPGTISTLLKTWCLPHRDAAILHPTFNGICGHPPLISAELIPDILSWRGQGGLKGFLETCRTRAMRIPVFDEFILRDMDTPSDYEALSRAIARYSIPTPGECEAMLTSPTLFHSGTAAHCRAVANLAIHLGSRLMKAGHSDIDLPRLRAAAMLHDIAKGQPGHAAAGASLLRQFGFSGISDIVAAHVDIDVPDTGPPTEAEVVYLSDKLVRGDTLVTLSERFGRKLARYGHDPDAQLAIRKRLLDAEAIACRVERFTDTPFTLILSELRGVLR